MKKTTVEILILLIASLAVLCLSGFAPKDRLTWVLEVFPAILGIVVLALTYRSFPLTRILYRLIFIHIAILCVGGHYNYAEVPVGFWLQDLFGLTRNPYDRIGHFAQGFVPAILVREILIRKNVVGINRWLFFFTTSICLAFSACYELIEWMAAVILGQGAEAFLGTQGDQWDTQWDMFMALVGALVAQLSLSKRHQDQLGEMLPHALPRPPQKSPTA